MAQTVKRLSAMQETWVRSLGLGRPPWRRKWQPTPVLLPGKSHGRGSLVGYSPWGCKEPDTTTLSLSSLFLIKIYEDSSLFLVVKIHEPRKHALTEMCLCQIKLEVKMGTIFSVKSGQLSVSGGSRSCRL